MLVLLKPETRSEDTVALTLATNDMTASTTGTTAINGMTATTAMIGTTASATSSSFATTTVLITGRCPRACRSATTAAATCHPDGRRRSTRSRCTSSVNWSSSRMGITAESSMATRSSTTIVDSSSTWQCCSDVVRPTRRRSGFDLVPTSEDPPRLCRNGCSGSSGGSSLA